MSGLRKKVKKRLFKQFSGRKRFQYFFEKMHEFALAGMNFGGGDNIKYSGEANIIKLLKGEEFSKRDLVIFDVGANVGNYTLELISAVKGGARVYSFEPMKETFAKLKDNTMAYKNVKVYNFGFCEKGGKMPIYADKDDSTLASVYKRRMSHLGVDVSYKEEVSMRSVDDFCKTEGISRIDLLKIDVEGGELSVLKGAGSLIDSGSISLIQFEFGGFNIASRTFFQDFFFYLDPHFRIYRVLKDGFEAVDSYKESYEIFLTTIYLAVSRREAGLLGLEKRGAN